MSHQAAGGAIDEEVMRGNWIAIVNYNIIKAIRHVETTEKEISIPLLYKRKETERKERK
jgi:hypothetical protein